MRNSGYRNWFHRPSCISKLPARLQHTSQGTYQELKRGEKIVWTDESGEDDDHSTVTVNLDAVPAGTEATLCIEGIPENAAEDYGVAEAWEGSLRRRRQGNLDPPRVLSQVPDTSWPVVVNIPYRKKASNSPELTDEIARRNRRSTEHTERICSGGRRYRLWCCTHRVDAGVSAVGAESDFAAMSCLFGSHSKAPYEDVWKVEEMAGEQIIGNVYLGSETESNPGIR